MKKLAFGFREAKNARFYRVFLENRFK